MQNSLNTKHPYYNDLRLNLRAIIGISLGIFLFLLFFQPLNPQNPDFNNKLLVLAAFGGITLILLGVLRIIIPSTFPESFTPEKWTINKEILWDLLFVVLNSVAFVFFARYVGKIPVTFHIVTIIVILTLTAVAILAVVNEYHFLKKRVIELTTGTIDYKDEILPKENVQIEFESENKSEYFNIFLDQILLIKSANNYVEVIYKEEENINKKLIRNTLTNTERLLSKYPTIIRCHRSCIVNRKHIQKITKGNEGLKLTLFDYPQDIYVSRQYVLKVKEALKTY
ncbi:MAG: LytTR family transcriptional regulator DNA-binding domain-containing protein [Bacteroidetes bacterium]|nr:LytTR family transcriptional regulator DNA-binding domain-containing protein [Bacteroidota bacterium]